MPHTVNDKFISDLDNQLSAIHADLTKAGAKAIDICGPYKKIRPALITLIKFLDGLPGWMKPGWLGTIITAIKTLMALLDRICP